MANKALFTSYRGPLTPPADAINEAGGLAYNRTDKQALAQLATTGCLGVTVYGEAESQLEYVLHLAERVEPEYLAKLAVYARQTGAMKDMPALLCAILSRRSPQLLEQIIPQVIDSAKMLRNFVQIMRSGLTGRKSLGTLPKRLIRQWLESRPDRALFIGSVGNAPSLADIVKMVHPKPTTPTREALFGYMIGREHNRGALPPLVQQYENFKQQRQHRAKKRGKQRVPDVPFQLLTALPLTQLDWQQIAASASWQMTRMNLNTFLRHGVFNNPRMTRIVAERLRNPKLIQQARAFPYQLMAAYMNASKQIPNTIREALLDAMEIAIQNVPTVGGSVFVCVDVSGSMHSSVTGHRVGASSAVRCLDVAALVAAAILRKNPSAEVIPFKENVVDLHLNPRDTVMTNAQKISQILPGGTNCSAPLAELNRRRARADLVVFVSDNESWIDSPRYGLLGGGRTETMRQWDHLKQRNPRAKMVCIDIQPYTTTQAVERPDVVNVGGFSDHVFKLLSDVAAGNYEPNHWVQQIEKIAIETRAA